MEDVSALQLQRRRGRQRLREADHAHVVCVLLQLRTRVTVVATTLQTGQTGALVPDAATHVATAQDLRAAVGRVRLPEERIMNETRRSI